MSAACGTPLLPPLPQKQFCTWVSKLRPRALSDGESSCELMGGIIQWLMKQLIETEKVLRCFVAPGLEVIALQSWQGQLMWRMLVPVMIEAG